MSEQDQIQDARRAFGNRLRGLRLDAGLSGVDLARQCGWHKSKISKIEHGTQVPTESNLRAWADACGAVEQIPELIASHRQLDEMWEEYRHAFRAGLNQQSARIRPLYERTKLVRAYESQTIPGFLQTRDYTRAVVADVSRFHGLAEDVDLVAGGRMNRRRVLESARCAYSFVVEAPALYAVRGGVPAMLEQLDYIERAASFPNVALGIIPLGSHRNIWPGEGFYVYDDVLVRSEHWTGGYRTKRPSEIAIYLRFFNLLRDQAVYGDAARAELETARRRLRGT
ncbi:helix-turn-helix domain-containing protein [Actinomadura harenae]|uniref:helix-turn-helix domain-containing protein n=1 Tax=Actinomadura harenae TaxID=2483351 RepID=UPI001315ABEA|nr:helix-turn-helix transcriptional regulator [Actinomadura harenae]